MRISHIQPMREYKLTYATHELVALALALGLLSQPSHVTARTAVGPEPVSGSAQVIDGDTIAIGDTRIRLEGIDAPESGQTCKRKWFGSWACGAAATDALQNLLSGKHGQLRAARPRQVRPHAGGVLRRRPGRQCADGAAGLRLGLRQVFDELRERGGRSPRPGCRHLAGRGDARLGIPRAALDRRRAAGAARAAPSRATSPSTAASITCPGAPGTRRSGSSPTRASAGSAPRPKRSRPGGGRCRRIEGDGRSAPMLRRCHAARSFLRTQARTLGDALARHCSRSPLLAPLLPR